MAPPRTTPLIQSSCPHILNGEGCSAFGSVFESLGTLLGIPVGIVAIVLLTLIVCDDKEELMCQTKELRTRGRPDGREAGEDRQCAGKRV